MGELWCGENSRNEMEDGEGSALLSTSAAVIRKLREENEMYRKNFENVCLRV